MAEFSSFQYKTATQATLEACDEVGILKNPLPTDDEATLATKIIASTSMSAVDVNVSEEPDRRAKLIVNAKSGIDPSGAAADTDDIAWYARNTTASRFELVTDIVDKEIVNGANDTVNVPQMVTYVGEVTSVV